MAKRMQAAKAKKRSLRRKAGAPVTVRHYCQGIGDCHLLRFMRDAVDQLGQSIVMVTHDPASASNADRIVFLADGRIVDEMVDPTAERVLDRMKRFGE